MIDFCILGSGMSGSTISNLLSKKYSVEVFDKARGPGGRLSNKRYNSKLNFDHGAQYITPKNDYFKKFILNLYRNKIMKVWEGNHLDFSFRKSTLNKKYIGKYANNDICKYQLKNIKKNYFSPIVKINFTNNHWEIFLENNKKYQFKALIITSPYPQLKKLAKKYIEKKIINLDVKMQPNITMMLAIKNKIKLPISSIKFNDDILAWASNENSKNRFKSNINLWTLQSTIKWAKQNINSYKYNKKIANKMQSRFLELTGFEKNKIIFNKIHGWKYSYNLSKTPLKSYWSRKYNMGVCADWFNGSKVEDSWISANDLFLKIKKNPLIIK
tara:strand:- start:1326 stop:2309 length:984 start_codon:yes stop_codon:yes gene_type:complete